MPHTISTWKEVIADTKTDPTWHKAFSRFIKKGYSETELKQQHQAWKSQQVKQVMSKSEKK
jgi:hypothetical protein